MFAVVHCEAIPDHVRGYLSRFLQQIHTGLYVGVVTDTVLEELWSRIRSSVHHGTATLLWSDPTIETGFDMRLHNVTTHRIVDLDGVRLPVETPKSAE